MPLVSIIIPCYNAEAWIAECLDSAVAQTHRPLEIIVVDDGSTDGSLEIIREYAMRYPYLIQYETGPNTGGCAARNRGFAISRGAFIMFLDADDLLGPKTIAAQVKALLVDRQCIAVSTSWFLTQRNKGWVKYRASKAPRRFDDIQCELAGYQSHGELFPRSVIEAVNGWDEELLVYQDVDFRLRCLLSGYHFVKVKNAHFYYRLHRLPSTSKASSKAALRSRFTLLGKIERLMESNRVLVKYSELLAKNYYHLFLDARSISATDLEDECLQNAYRLSGGAPIRVGTWKHRLFSALLGVQRKERLVKFLLNHNIGSAERKAYHER